MLFKDFHAGPGCISLYQKLHIAEHSEIFKSRSSISFYDICMSWATKSHFFAPV